MERTVATVGGRIPVILNLAENTTKDAQSFAKMAEELGADGLMLLPPMRYRADDRETVVHFRAVAQSTPLPMLIYNNPVDYSTYVNLEMFEELLRHPNVQAVKESTRDLANVTRLKNRFGDRLKVLGGVDTISLETLMIGADGLVAGEYKKAVELYRWFMPLLELDIHPKLIQYIKLAATREGLATPYTRSPRLPLVGEEKERISKIIGETIASRPKL